MHTVDSIWNINWNLKTKHRNVGTDEMKIHHQKIEVITPIASNLSDI
jgi:transcription elongation GreA/GreB family factor